MKYQQKAENYTENEYPNMPSLDFCYLPTQRDLITANKDEIDWDLVKSICNKYGFCSTIISGTFGKQWVGDKLGFACEFLVYKKIDFDYREFAVLEKTKQYDKIRELTNKYAPLILKLHDCVHELDEETDLVFNTGWAGNCGLFGSDKVMRKTYFGGDYLYSWERIIDKWSPLINDTNSMLSKGVYFFITSRWIKTITN